MFHRWAGCAGVRWVWTRRVVVFICRCWPECLAAFFWLELGLLAWLMAMFGPLPHLPAWMVWMMPDWLRGGLWAALFLLRRSA